MANPVEEKPSSTDIYKSPYGEGEQQQEVSSPLSLDSNSSAILEIMSTKDWIDGYAFYLRGHPKPSFNPDSNKYETTAKPVRQPILNELGVSFVLSKIGINADPNAKMSNLTLDRISTICDAQSEALLAGLFFNQNRFNLSNEDCLLMESIVVDVLNYIELSLKHAEGGKEQALSLSGFKQTKVEVVNSEPQRSRGWIEKAKDWVRR